MPARVIPAHDALGAAATNPIGVIFGAIALGAGFVGLGYGLTAAATSARQQTPQQRHDELNQLSIFADTGAGFPLKHPRAAHAVGVAWIVLGVIIFIGGIVAGVLEVM
jgi:hypothetical protein